MTIREELDDMTRAMPRGRGFLVGLSLLAMVAALLPLWAGPARAGGHPVVSIGAIQGSAHTSPFEGVFVETTGVVTAHAFDGYYVQDPVGDGDVKTSDGLFVFKFGSKPPIGNLVTIADTVTEFVPGGCGTGNLSITQMSFPSLTDHGPGPAVTPTIIGLSGLIPPAVDVISSDEVPVNLQPSFCPGGGGSSTFDPAADGIDFYESLEGMLVTVEDAQAVSATRRFGTFSAEFFTVPNQGHPKIIEPNNALTARGGIQIQADADGYGDLNPERVQIQLSGTPLYPGDMNLQVKVGDLVGDVTGVVGYSFGNFEVNAIEEIDVVDGGVGEETTTINPKDKWVTVASYNVLNLSVGDVFDDEGPDDVAQFAELGSQIANNLKAPDVVALQEIQDDSGEADDGTVTADATLQELVDSIVAAGGPTYVAFDVDPVDGTQGGVPGGNIRTAFLYNPDRVDLLGFTALDAALLTAAGADPTAFDGTRIPLVGFFEFDGEEFTVISVHNTSRFGSTPIFGGPQPFVQAGEAEREAETTALNQYVDFLLSSDPDANVIVAGDFNTFEFTDELTEDLPGPEPVLSNLYEKAKTGDGYSFIFDGNSQMLDHIFVTKDVSTGAQFDVVHVNVDFPRTFINVTGSDHEPLLAQLKLKK